MAKTLTISPQNIHTIIRGEVVDVMREVLGDPDAGLKFTAGFTRRLKKSLRDKKMGGFIPLTKVLKQYGI